MNNKTDRPGSMDRLFSGLIQVNQRREQSHSSTEESAPQSISEQKEEEDVSAQQATLESQASGNKRREKNGREQFLFRVDEELMLKTRQVSNLHCISLCDIMNYALKNFITSYEEKYGVIKKKGNRISIDKLL